MERTGTSFEMKPDTFTLENMFSMELHKYSAVIGEIVTAAVKEIGIEKVHFHPCHHLKTKSAAQLANGKLYIFAGQLNLQIQKTFCLCS